MAVRLISLRPLAALALVAFCITPLGLSTPAVAQAAAACPTEQYPPLGEPRNGPYNPYEIPIVAQLEFAYIRTATANGAVQVVIGPMFGTACGLAALPSLAGTIQPQNITLFGRGPAGVGPPNPQIPVQILTMGLPVAAVYASSSGTIHANLSRTPAANGGIDGYEAVTFKVTLSTYLVSGLAQCTLITGNIATPGLGASQADIADSMSYDKSDPKHYNLLSPMVLTTGTSVGPDPGEVIQGQPVTGPPTAGVTVVVNRSSSVGKFYPDIPPATSAPSTALGCPATVATLFNAGFDLPLKAGTVTTVVPTTFAINIS